MRLGLVMLVKDEAHRVRQALGPLRHLLDEVIVFDTGSTDGTQDLLRELGVEPIPARTDPARCDNLADLRNRGLDLLRTPWRLCLDADERIAPEALRALLATEPPAGVDGLFVRWENHLEDGTTFEDYKCPIFREGVRHVGLIHENVQQSIRHRGTTARWTSDVVLHHHPEARKDAAKRDRYLRRLRSAMALEPDVPRYPWFAGCMRARWGDPSGAVPWLVAAATSGCPDFPVERLNAHVLLADLAARRGDRADCLAWLERGHHLFLAVADDFEVRVNRRLGPWLEVALAAAHEGDLDRVRAYRFAC